MTDHVFALLLSEAKNVVRGHKLLTSKKWEWKISSAYQGMELDGTTLGIAGFGSLGRLVPPKAKGFGMKVLVYDPYVLLMSTPTQEYTLRPSVLPPQFFTQICVGDRGITDCK